MADFRERMLEEVERDPRRQFGWGPSQMASAEEKAAYEAFVRMPLVESGRLSVSDLPEEYGGRPTGTSRRAIRMQEEWDKRKQQQLINQRIIQQLESEQRDYNLRLRTENRMQKDQDLAIRAAEMDEERNEEIQRGADFILQSVRGGVPLRDGGYSEPIRPSDPDALTRITNLLNSDGAEHPIAKDVLTKLYNETLKYEEGRMAESEAQQSWLVKQQEEASMLGIDTSKFVQIDPETKGMKVDQLGLAKEVGLARRSENEERQKQIAQAKIDDDTRSQAKDIVSEINKLDSEIRKEQFSANRQKNTTLKQGHIDNVEFLSGERDVLVQRYNSLVPQPTEEEPQAEIPKFNSVEEAEAANLQAGTVIEINGRRARID